MNASWLERFVRTYLKARRYHLVRRDAFVDAWNDPDPSMRSVFDKVWRRINEPWGVHVEQHDPRHLAREARERRR